MKDLIVLSAYCPDEERLNILKTTLESLLRFKDRFDILLSTHSNLPDYITSKVNYVFYEKENKLITPLTHDLKYMGNVWFKTHSNSPKRIYSNYVGAHSTYLAVYRLLIGGFGLGKVLGYKKAHWIEYDVHVPDNKELIANSSLLDSVDSISYRRPSSKHELYGIGSFMAVNLDKIDKRLWEWDEEELLKLHQSHGKVNETVTDYLFSLNNHYYKDSTDLLNQGYNIGQSNETSKDSLVYWTVPYFDPNKNTIDFLCWNQKDKGIIDVSVIVNNKKLITFNQVHPKQWYSDTLGSVEEVNSILILINNKVKNYIDFNITNKQDFIKYNNIR